MHSIEQSLQDYLLKRWPDANAVSIEGLAEILGGYCKQTYSFDAHVTQGAAKKIHPLILRKDIPAATAISQNSREIEHALLNRLREHTRIPVPESYFVEMNRETFGEPAMIMQRVLGSASAGALFQTSEVTAEAESVARALCEALAALHTADTSRLNSDGIFNDPKGLGIVPDSWSRYLDGTLDYLINNYSNIDFDALPVFYDAYLQMRRTKPRPLPLGLVHGDLNPSNLIYKDGKLLAILDWESAHIGDPREDLAYLQVTESFMRTRFFSSVNYPGGFLGYYNHLTGFTITQEELGYFHMFSFATATAQLLAAIKRRVLGQHNKVLHMYLIQFVLGTVMLYGQALGYFDNAR
jgi:aminoglycoside phosphotransferase (APT) family kinase protein